MQAVPRTGVRGVGDVPVVALDPFACVPHDARCVFVLAGWQRQGPVLPLPCAACAGVSRAGAAVYRSSQVGRPPDGWGGLFAMSLDQAGRSDKTAARAEVRTGRQQGTLWAIQRFRTKSRPSVVGTGVVSQIRSVPELPPGGALGRESRQVERPPRQLGPE
jgi:hypothetical protein